jgi:hypothetical protein
MAAFTPDLGHVGRIATVLAAVLAELAVFSDLAAAARMRALVRLGHDNPSLVSCKGCSTMDVD